MLYLRVDVGEGIGRGSVEESGVDRLAAALAVCMHSTMGSVSLRGSDTACLIGAVLYFELYMLWKRLLVTSPLKSLILNSIESIHLKD